MSCPCVRTCADIAANFLELIPCASGEEIGKLAAVDVFDPPNQIAVARLRILKLDFIMSFLSSPPNIL